MAFTLKRNVAVAADPQRDDYEPNMMVTLEAGTAIEDISDYEQAQLAPEHFEDVGDPDALPDDWRDDSARERDAVQKAAMDQIEADRAARREELRAAAAAENGEDT